MSSLPDFTGGRNDLPAEKTRRLPALALVFPTLRNLVVCEATEFTSGFEGRSFRLKNLGDRSSWSCHIARNGQDHVCQCRRFKTTGRCKHVKALLALLDFGVLDSHYDPDRPESVFPSPQQLGDEAGVELPF